MRMKRRWIVLALEKENVQLKKDNAMLNAKMNGRINKTLHEELMIKLTPNTQQTHID